MPTISEIKEQVKKIDGGTKFWGRKEIKELPSVLWEDERVENLVQGMYGKGIGILVASNKRLVFIDKGMFSLRVEDFPYDKISSIQYETGLFGGKIIIFASGNKAEISQIDKRVTKNFAEFIRARISGVQEHKSISVAAKTGDDPYAELEKLASLKDKGVITEEEFNKKKEQLLGL